MPKRVQMTRDKPWRCDNPDAVIVDRRTKWGNPYRVGVAYDGDEQGPYDAATAVDRYEFEMFMILRGYCNKGGTESLMSGLAELRGKDLACWCALDQPCHADVLLKLANEPQEPATLPTSERK